MAHLRPPRIQPNVGGRKSLFPKSYVPQALLHQNRTAETFLTRRLKRIDQDRKRAVSSCENNRAAFEIRRLNTARQLLQLGVTRVEFDALGNIASVRSDATASLSKLVTSFKNKAASIMAEELGLETEATKKKQSMLNANREHMHQIGKTKDPSISSVDSDSDDYFESEDEETAAANLPHQAVRPSKQPAKTSFFQSITNRHSKGTRDASYGFSRPTQKSRSVTQIKPPEIQASTNDRCSQRLTKRESLAKNSLRAGVSFSNHATKFNPSAKSVTANQQRLTNSQTPLTPKRSRRKDDDDDDDIIAVPFGRSQHLSMGTRSQTANPKGSTTELPDIVPELKPRRNWGLAANDLRFQGLMKSLIPPDKHGPKPRIPLRSQTVIGLLSAVHVNVAERV